MKNELVFFPRWAAGRSGFAEKIRDVFHDQVKKKGLVQTHQRDEILNHLLNADRHLTQEEIYEALKGRGIGKVTVFRTLKLLEEAQLVDRVYDTVGRPRYEIKMERPHHDHLVCVDCGAIQEVQWPEIEKVQERECRRLGFVPLRHRHEVFGRCAACAAKG